MKKLLLLCTVFLSVTIAKAQSPSPTNAQTDINKLIEFTDLDHDFGKIPYGKSAEYDLILKNISN